MRRAPWCYFFSTLNLLQYSASLSGSIQTRALQPPVTPPALDGPRSFCPRFFPTTRAAHSHLLFSVFEDLTASQSTGPPSFPDRPESVAMEQIGVTSDEATGDTPNDCSNSDSSWAAPKFFSDLSAFNITHFASGRDNLEVVAGVTFDPIARADDTSSWITWTNASTMLQLLYPKDSVNPAGWPQGGSEFYAEPLDLSDARSVTFAYSVFFPSEFEWVKGGKLPGLYGGRTGCSGGDPALDCFSTRLMWREGGAGELYLVSPASALSVPLHDRAHPFSFFVVRAERSAGGLLMQRTTPHCLSSNVRVLHCPGFFQVFCRVVDECQPDRCAQYTWYPRRQFSS
jgi:hypothetical protein